MQRSKKTSKPHKYAELLATAFFYKQTQPNLQTLDLLKIMGFQTAGLQRRFGRVLPSPRPHVVVWNPTLQWGICLCGKWQEVGEEARGRYRHKVHERLKVRESCEGPGKCGKLKSVSRTTIKWRMQCRCSSHKTLTSHKKEE